MKIWITKENREASGTLETHYKKPTYYLDKMEGVYSFSGGDSSAMKLIKTILNLDDWPNHEEVLEYDTVKEEGLIFHGKYL